MALIVPDVGEVALLDVLTASWGNTLVMKLFQNNYTPVDGTELTDLTEADFDGYSPIVLTGWTAAATVGGKAQSEALEVEFEHDGGATGNTVYGYWVEDQAGFLLWVERDPNGPVTMDNASHRYRITPKLTLATE